MPANDSTTGPTLQEFERFWSYVDIEGPQPEHLKHLGPCWIWKGARKPKGYGRFKFRGRNVSATRFVLGIATQPLADGMQACHHCDNPPCVSPFHLFAGTLDENVEDALIKRALRVKRLTTPTVEPEPVKRYGEMQYSLFPPTTAAKLNDSSVAALRRDHAAGTKNADLAKKYGVSKWTIGEIIARRSWRHVE